MKKGKKGQRFLLFILTASIVLTMQGLPVIAETLPLENQPEQPDEPNELPETTAEQTDSATPENPESTEAPEPAETDNNPMAEAEPEEADIQALTLDAAVLADHIITGYNPDQAVVNLFDYWQYPGERYGREEAHDYWTDDTKQTAVTTYNIGISKGHLLRFAYRADDDACDYCKEKGDYGDWNKYSSVPREEIVKNRLDADGFPILNLADESSYGHYADSANSDVYLTEKAKHESLAYLFSVTDDTYKKSYANVKGLFQLDNAGYYYYNSKKNFAEFDEASNRFILYDSPGVSDSKNDGQFFPFNKATEVFDTADGNGLSYMDNAKKEDVSPDYAPTVTTNGSFIKCYAPGMNHYLGMTLEVPFLQPVGGLLPNKDAMRFNFSGDDDVWIFIDGVLVADLGGLHDACSLEINFATGQVFVNGQATPTLLKCFQDAYNTGSSDSNPGGVAFVRDRFADNTVHTLKMFYLERGNMASNLSLSFNLQAAHYNQIQKVDQNGISMKNVEFSLYEAQTCAEDADGSILCNSTVSLPTCYVRQTGTTPLLTIKTGADGIANFADYSFPSTTQYYILHETSPPEGYRSQPVDIVLEYNPATTMLSVANRWTTGAYASFTSYVNEQPGVGIHYGEYQGNGVIKSTASSVDESSRKNGLVLAVPMLQRGAKDSSEWLPLYGSNLDGFHTTATGDAGDTPEGIERALLEAALHQCLYDKGWYLEWNAEMDRLEGSLSDLPGRADRYLHENANGDMQMAYIMIEPGALAQIGISATGSEAKYMALKQYVMTHGVAAAAATIYGSPAAGDSPGNRNVNLLNVTEFIRLFRSLIYISNEQRELRVRKVDNNGIPLNGAEFGIYASMDDAQGNRNPVATGITANVDGEDGILIFKPQPDGETGYARMVWANAPNQTYYLKEISAPDGYEVNETIIPIVIGIYSIYADAGTENDGVSVMAGAGRLYRTMVKYASDGDVNITLRDITAIAQKQDSGKFTLDGWTDTKASGQTQEMDLHYGINLRMGMNYGFHDEVSDEDPFFITDTGFLRVRVIQNTDALRDELYDGAVNIANWYDLTGTDLTALFSLLNVVVVEDRQGGTSTDNFENPVTEDETAAMLEKNIQTNMQTSLNTLLDRIGTPQTGDDSLIWWWAFLSGVSLLGSGAATCNLVLVKRKSKKQAPEEKQKKQVLKGKQKKPKKQSLKRKQKKQKKQSLKRKKKKPR